MFEPKLI